MPRAYRVMAVDAQGDRVRVASIPAVAVLIASNLRKEITGAPLFDGVSFKVERRDRLALAGANGAGKTTLLRALVGEVSLEGGELAFEKGTRIALHDQRPPAASERPLRDYVLAGTADLAAVESGAARARAGDGGRRARRAHASRATPPRRRGSSTRAATTGATAPPASCAGSASPTTTSTGRSRPSPAAS